jgi:hypothetical protein
LCGLWFILDFFGVFEIWAFVCFVSSVVLIIL